MALAQVYEELRIGDYGLSINAREQMEKRNITADQIEQALLYPEKTHASSSNGTRASYSDSTTTVYTNDRTHTILAVIATAELLRLSEGARKLAEAEAARIGARTAEPEPGEVVPSTQDLSRMIRALNGSKRKSRRRGVPHQHQYREPEVCVQHHLLDQVHPALRAEVTRQVDGDFSRLVIHSATNVTVLPPL